ncbi:MAG TPA: sigma-70 family RNA polymerase sigma factor [Phycisphaerales bacterium]|nr:sigma-70 family RNA polymerase sigma factor [Phycisphaerales bacterium]
MQVGGNHGDRLVALARAGDEAALRALWAENRRWVAAVIITHKPTRAELDDILQDVAATLCQKVQDVEDEAAFRGWLRMVAVNAARLAGRKHEVRQRHTAQHAAMMGEEGRAGQPGSGAGAPSTATLPGQMSEEAQRVLDAARSLPEEYSEPLLLRAVQGLSYRAIGQIMELPETTIETRIARARRMLRDALERKQSATLAGARLK